MDAPDHTPTYGLMYDDPTDRTIYVLAAIPVLLFVVSIWYEAHANRDQQGLQIFEPPNQKIGGPRVIGGADWLATQLWPASFSTRDTFSAGRE